MKIGLLGYPQAGKRTLFTLLTGRAIPESRHPGEALEGTASIRDPRVGVIAGICTPQKTVYAENQFVLCPDIVSDAGARGWLDASRRCDLLCLAVRAFESEDVYHPDGSVDADRDMANLRAELLLADMELAEKRLRRMEKEKRAGQTDQQKRQEAVLKKCLGELESDRPIREMSLEPHEAEAIRNLELVTAIPTLELFNVAEDALGAGVPVGTVAVSARLEQEIMEIDDPSEREEYLQAMGLEATGLDRVNAAAYEAQGLMSFYTMGPDEARAWTIRRGATAPIAGGKIHTDIQRGFIRVEVIKFDDLLAAGSEKAAKDHGKTQTKGKDYIIEDGDICHFLFNV
jgi:GTP-binding protein YchF